MSGPQQFFRSLTRAGNALVAAVREERNFRLLAVASAAAVISSLGLGVRGWEFGIVVLACATVLALELVNSALERLVDMVQPRVHHYAGTIKSMLAAAVLVAAGAALVAVTLVLWPHLSERLSGVVVW